MTTLPSRVTHLGATIRADIIKQKLPEHNRAGFKDIGFGKTDARVYSDLASDHPIDMCRYQVANCYLGQCGLINSGGASSGASDTAAAVLTAVVNKHAGGMGLIMGRKAFQRPMRDGVAIIQAVQDVYRDPAITVA